MAVDKKDDDLARAALRRAENHRELAEDFAQQLTDQKTQVDDLKIALCQLEQRLTEAQAKADLLIARQHRARGQAKSELAAGDIEGRLAALEKEDHIEQLLRELKAKRGA